MSLADAAVQLGIAPNSVRSRYKAGKLRGERDNSGRIWVWVDPSNLSSTRRQIAPISKPSNEFEIEALKATISDLKDQVADLREDRDAWRQQAQDLARSGNFWSLFKRR